MTGTRGRTDRQKGQTGGWAFTEPPRSAQYPLMQEKAPASDRPRRRSEASPERASPGHAMLDLQRAVGNKAVTALMGAPLDVQRDWTTGQVPVTRPRSNAVVGDRPSLPPSRPVPAIPPVAVSQQINSGTERAAGLVALAALGPAAQALTVVRLSPEALTDPKVSVALLPIVGTLPKGSGLSDEQKGFLGRVMTQTPATEVELLRLTTAVRFDVEVKATAGGGQEWDAPTLKQMYPVLAQLPPSHVESNTSLDALTRNAANAGASASGSYNGSTRQGKIGVDTAMLGAANTAADQGDPLRGVNRFNKVVRHEVGHAVDDALSWSKGAGPGDAARGGWRRFDDTQAVVRQALADGGSPLAGDAEVIGLAGAQLVNHVDVVAGMKASPAYAGWSAEKKEKVEACPVLPQLKAGFASATPWYKNPAGGPVLGGRVFIESYAGRNWYSYDSAARAKKVSQYQFRAPGEWFAEAYATYHEPDPGGVGKLLEPRDASTKAWLDELHKNPLPTK